MQTKFNLIWIYAINDAIAKDTKIICRQNSIVFHWKYMPPLRSISATAVTPTSSSEKIFGQATIKILLVMEKKNWKDIH